MICIYVDLLYAGAKISEPKCTFGFSSFVLQYTTAAHSIQRAAEACSVV